MCGCVGQQLYTSNIFYWMQHNNDKIGQKLGGLHFVMALKILPEIGSAMVFLIKNGFNRGVKHPHGVIVTWIDQII